MIRLYQFPGMPACGTTQVWKGVLLLHMHCTEMAVAFVMVLDVKLTFQLQKHFFELRQRLVPA
jgi:hypothetical protein